jgi:addiction module RelE/StbE family toxin
MLDIRYKPSFIRDFKKLPTGVQEEAFERIELFKNTENHKKLKVHKLKGRLKDFHSFSITYSHRIVFMYEKKTVVVFLAVGDHDVYR